MKTALLFLAEGFEEVEAVTPIDFLRRAGIKVETVGIGGPEITGGHGIQITADITFSDLDEVLLDSADILIFPGGMPGASNIAAEKRVISIIQEFNRKGKLIAAICASPAVILSPSGVLEGRSATCYPGMEKAFSSGTTYSSERVVVDRNIVTSRGPGTAMVFSYVIVKLLEGRLVAEDLIEKALYEVS